MTQTPDITPEAIRRELYAWRYNRVNQPKPHELVRMVEALSARLAEVEAALVATAQREADTTARYDAKLAEVEAERDRLDTTILAIREVMYVEKARAEAAEARNEELEAKLKWVLEERDTTFALMLKRAESAEAIAELKGEKNE